MYGSIYVRYLKWANTLQWFNLWLQQLEVCCLYLYFSSNEMEFLSGIHKLTCQRMGQSKTWKRSSISSSIYMRLVLITFYTKHTCMHVSFTFVYQWYVCTVRDFGCPTSPWCASSCPRCFSSSSTAPTLAIGCVSLDSVFLFALERQTVVSICFFLSSK